MKLLLDTHILLWCLSEPQRLSTEARREIARASNEVFYSSVSLFELACKRAAGRSRRLAIEAEQVHRLAVRAGYQAILVTPEHAIAVETLAPFHGDPVDRLLLAQAQIERMRLVTHDERLAAYDPRTILS